jgi:hypothetical protein
LNEFGFLNFLSSSSCICYREFQLRAFLVANHFKGIYLTISMVRVMMEEFLLLGHGVCHTGSQRGAVPVVVGPHALQVEKGYPIAVLEVVIDIWLKARHGTEVAVDEGDAPLLGGQSQTPQEIAHLAPGWQIKLQAGVALTGRLATIVR